MTTWTHDGSAIDLTTHTFHVKLTAHQWSTAGQTGYEKGGPVVLVDDIDQTLRTSGSYKSFVVARRATRTLFAPEILAKHDILSEVLCTPQRIAGLGLGPHYDMFVSFTSKEEATLFKLSFRGDVGVGFSGIN